MSNVASGRRAGPDTAFSISRPAVFQQRQYLQSRLVMYHIEVLKSRRQSRKHCLSVAEVYAADVVVPEGIDEVFDHVLL